MAIDRRTSEPIDQRVSPAARSYLDEIIDTGPGVPIHEIAQMAETHHRDGVGLQLKALIAAARIGTWSHESEEIQQFVRSSGIGLAQNLPTIAEMAMGAEIFGFVMMHFTQCVEDDGWAFGGLWPIHPGCIEQFVPDDDTGEIIGVEISETPDELEFNKVVHIAANRHLSFGNPYGVSSAKRALALWKAGRINMRQWAIAAQRQATKLLHANIDSELAEQKLYNDQGKCLLDGKGKPLLVPGVVAAKQQLAQLQTNQNFLVTQGTTVQALSHESNGQFFERFAEYIDREMLLSLAFPETTITVGAVGLGNSGLAEQHNKILMMTVDAVLSQLQEQLMSKVIKPLITWNFGEQEDYGSWSITPEQDEARVQIAQLLWEVIKEPAAADVIGFDELEKFRARLVELVV